jgi:hypothetical protein
VCAMSDNTDDATYWRNVKEQYEVLGRFIEAFELMVSEVRNICIMLLAHDGNNDNLLDNCISPSSTHCEAAI